MLSILSMMNYMAETNALLPSQKFNSIKQGNAVIGYEFKKNDLRVYCKKLSNNVVVIFGGYKQNPKKRHKETEQISDWNRRTDRTINSRNSWNIMITNKELQSTPEYWTTRIQLDLYTHLQNYMTENGLNRTQLAQKLGVTKGYVTQVLNGDFDHRLSKLVELSLAVGLIPKMEFIPQTEYLEESVEVEPVPRPSTRVNTLKKSKPIRKNAKQLIEI